MIKIFELFLENAINFLLFLKEKSRKIAKKKRKCVYGKKYLNNQDYHNTIKSIAKEKRKSAQNAIYNRLERWANDEWIDDTEDFFKILERFREEYIHNYSREIDCLENWECGLCQIIDLQDENVCALLPYLLTAYVYNFPRNKFVTGFLALAKISGIKEDLSFWSARTKDENYALLLKRDETGEDLTYGIGKLLASACVLSNRGGLHANLKKGLSNCKKRFCVSGIHRYPEDDDPYNYYLILPDRSKTFFRDVKKSDRDRPIPGSALARDERLYYSYREERLMEIFFSFYAISHNILKNGQTSPNALYSYLLIIEDFKNQHAIDSLKSFCEGKSKREIQKELSKDFCNQDNEQLDQRRPSHNGKRDPAYDVVTTLHELEEVVTKKRIPVSD